MRQERQGTLCQSLHNMFIIIFITKLIVVNGFVADEDPCRSQLWLNSPWLCNLHNGRIFSQSNDWQLVRNMPSRSSGWKGVLWLDFRHFKAEERKVWEAVVECCSGSSLFTVVSYLPSKQRVPNPGYTAHTQPCLVSNR